MVVRERVSHDGRLKRIRPTSAGIEMKEKVENGMDLLVMGWFLFVVGWLSDGCFFYAVL